MRSNTLLTQIRQQPVTTMGMIPHHSTDPQSVFGSLVQERVVADRTRRSGFRPRESREFQGLLPGFPGQFLALGRASRLMGILGIVQRPSGDTSTRNVPVISESTLFSHISSVREAGSAGGRTDSGLFNHTESACGTSRADPTDTPSDVKTTAVPDATAVSAASKPPGGFVRINTLVDWTRYEDPLQVSAFVGLA